MNPFASYYVLVCIKQMFLYQEKYTSDDGRTLSKYVMCVIWKYLTNVCLFNKISQSDQTMKISLKLPARCGGEPGDHKTKYEISILLTDLKLGRECMPAVQTLLGCRNISQSHFWWRTPGINQSGSWSPGTKTNIRQNSNTNSQHYCWPFQ